MTEKRLIPVGIVVMVIYALTVIHSNGYHQPDEHYQIIEFAGLKGGWNTGANLCWEYDAQIRPVLQPMIALGIFRVLNLFGVVNPFQLALGLRAFTALLSVFCILLFIRSFRVQVKPAYRTMFVLLSFLLWFLPAINVRFSSESWAGLALLSSVALLNVLHTDKNKWIRYLLAGVLWGLGFEFRFQMAIAFLGLFLWLIFVRKEKWDNLLSLLSGSLFIVVLCFFLDSWFYGNAVFVPWNYFNVNLVQNVAAQFGTEPWYYYIVSVFNSSTPLIGGLIFLSLLILGVFDYKNIVLWCVVPFLLVHSFISHKELRFLFPIVNFLPLMMVLAFQEVRKRWKNKQVLKAIVYPLGIVVFVVNLGGLTMLAFKPGLNGNINMLQYIDTHYKNVNLYAVAWSNPYILSTIKGLTPRFYANDKVTIKNLAKVMKPGSQEKLQDDDLVILLNFYHERWFLEKEGFVVEKKSIPDWVAWLDRFYKVYPDYSYTYVLFSKPQGKGDVK